MDVSLGVLYDGIRALHNWMGSFYKDKHDKLAVHGVGT